MIPTTVMISLGLRRSERLHRRPFWLWVHLSWRRHQMETFPRCWPFVRGIHRWPVNSHHKGQWRGALMFSLIFVGTNGWVNNRDVGDLRRHRAHYDVTVMVRRFFRLASPSSNQLITSVNLGTRRERRSPDSVPEISFWGNFNHCYVDNFWWSDENLVQIATFPFQWWRAWAWLCISNSILPKIPSNS